MMIETMATGIKIGRLLSAGNAAFTVGCSVSQVNEPSFGSLVRVTPNPAEDYHVYGLIHDIHIEDDGLVRQLVTTEPVDATVIADNRINRNVPVEMSVLAVGYRQRERIYHLLPPRPPLSLDVIYQCDADELRQFTAAGRFGYFRHVLRAVDLPVGELLAAHLQYARAAHEEAHNHEWVRLATRELITLLRDDYPTLMSVLGALGDVIP
jgi:hypothetical protein